MQPDFGVIVRQASSRGDSEEASNPLLGMQGHRSVAGIPVEEKARRGAAIQVDGPIGPTMRQGTRRGEAFRQLGKGERAQAFLAENAKKDGVVTLPSGLQYKVIEPGSGKSPGLEDSVTVNYRVTFVDGSEFDSSYKRREPTTFPVNGVIPGWVEALQLMQEGAHWQVFVPSELAYGNRGKLAGRTLIFDVTLKAVHQAGTKGDAAAAKGDGG